MRRVAWRFGCGRLLRVQWGPNAKALLYRDRPNNQQLNLLRSALRLPLRILGRKFEFLCGRDGSSFFYFATTGVDLPPVSLEEVFFFLGDFPALTDATGRPAPVALLAARLSLAMSASPNCFSFAHVPLSFVKDVKAKSNGVVMTDGCGWTSPHFAAVLAGRLARGSADGSRLEEEGAALPPLPPHPSRLAPGSIPSWFQVRLHCSFGCFKGMLVVNPLLMDGLALPPSMKKFESAQNILLSNPRHPSRHAPFANALGPDDNPPPHAAPPPRQFEAQVAGEETRKQPEDVEAGLPFIDRRRGSGHAAIPLGARQDRSSTQMTEEQCRPVHLDGDCLTVQVIEHERTGASGGYLPGAFVGRPLLRLLGTLAVPESWALKCVGEAMKIIRDAGTDIDAACHLLDILIMPSALQEEALTNLAITTKEKLELFRQHTRSHLHDKTIPILQTHRISYSSHSSSSHSSHSSSF
eukprot:GHVT01059800.1.p1 GENE.GHVT01059800.1~~GHVT01059800.1.p1  ORF type:complete len:467 (-),score=106.39 GHVT01059800.1:1344-2744(-)